MMKSYFKMLLCILLMLLAKFSIPCAELYALDWYVSPIGTSANTGSLNSPWNLQFALQGASGKIKAGDTVWLRGGTYTGLFTSTLTGTATSPIVVRSYSTEWAVVDGAPFNLDTQSALEVNGAHTWYRDFEVTNSNTTRPVTFPYRPATVNVFGPNTKFINMVVHDGGQGIGFWGQASNSEIYGCIIYNNGGEARDHGIYTQNNTGTKLIADNVIFNNYGYGIHAYGSGSTTPLAGYRFRENVLINDKNLIGNRPVQDFIFADNLMWSGAFNFGYNSPNNINAQISNNWFAATLINFMGWKNALIQANKFWKTGDPAGGLINVQYYTGYALSDYNFTKNTHYQFDASEYNDYYIAFPNGAYGYKFSNTLGGPPAEGFWQQTLGYDLDGSYVTSAQARPHGAEYFVRQNSYDPQRALITLYNWDGASSLNVPLSGLSWLKSGDGYILKNALNYLVESEAGIYNGSSISIDMTKWHVAAPVGDVPEISNRASPFPDMGAFVLIKTSSGSQTTPTPQKVPAAPKNLRVP